MKLYIVILDRYGIDHFAIYSDKDKAIEYAKTLPKTDKFSNGQSVVVEYETEEVIELSVGYDQDVGFEINNKDIVYTEPIYKHDIEHTWGK
jgi:uncharacterized protein YlzI (FlbEa/FlbD family)